MACTSKYIYSNCSTIAVGCTLYATSSLTTTLGAGYYKIPVGTGFKTFTANSSGVVTAESTCSWNASVTYAPVTTIIKNDCDNTGGCTSFGSTVNLNDGNPANSYSGYGSYTSYISQADADYQAQAIAVSLFDAGKQAAGNSRGYCTYTFSNGTGLYGAANYTRNNCGAGCEPQTITYPYVSKSGYSAQSTVSCTAAVSAANAAAYAAAEAESKSLGQAYANTYANCCCWVAASLNDKCNGCDYRGDRERNECSGAFRNDYVTEYSSCTCNVGCKGTNYNNNYCGGADGKDRIYYEIYNCNGTGTGASYSVNCGCDLGAQNLVSANSTTCSGCQNVTVYIDNNRCSSTYNHYFVNGSDVGTTRPSTASCNTTPDYGNDLGIKCLYGTNYYVLGNYNSCGNYRYKYYAGNEVNYTNSLDNFTNACTFSAYRSGTFTRNNCGSGYIGGSVSYSNTYYYSGIDGQSGADALADANFNNDGQNYANSNGSCTAIPTCYTYNIISNNDNVYVDGIYTTCAGYTDYFSFYSSFSYSVVGSVCAQASSVYVTQNGFESSSGGC